MYARDALTLFTLNNRNKMRKKDGFETINKESNVYSLKKAKLNPFG
ncbi:MAG: hypothetical protein AEth_00339 [Candidatus Argoarchaeum ethanivorans]|uniref:Uncharacterized protein n=1 Tax=Candidatus Argoarchaeum ethanivorans TaxID=2608793 RepID=A0A8B3S384_9EURY|nr:MAG: hypothetical protein AEth_00339 [Candidatus Argoarchaeum ethanivorans]